MVALCSKTLCCYDEDSKTAKLSCKKINQSTLKKNDPLQNYKSVLEQQEIERKHKSLLEQQDENNERRVTHELKKNG